jgi:hypothetical protein
MKLRSAMSTVMATAAALPLALGLAACGSDQPEATGYKPSVPPSTPVVTATTAAPQKAAPAVRLNRVNFVPAMNTAIARQKSWRIVGTMTANGQTVMTMDGFQTAKPAAMSMEMAGAAFQGKTAKLLVVKNVAYMSVPGMTPAGKFVRIDSAQAGDLGELLDGGDPTKIFKSFDSSLANVKFVRTETVGGQKLDRYDVTVNAAKALAAQGKKAPAGMPKTLTYSLWMDKSHLVRKLTFQLAGIGMVMTMSDYNKPVRITAPPASKIVR